jgi:hypothetical protein
MTATVDRSALQTGRNEQLRAAVIVFVGLVVLGAILGLVWAWWSPPRPPGVQLPAGTVQINESESFAAGDMRFAIITGLVGILAGVAIWFRREMRGPVTALALCLGGLAGAGLTSVVGNVVGGGTNKGPANTEILHLPLSLHLHGFYLLEGLLAALIYSILVAFAVDDDLGRPDPVRDQLRAKPVVDDLVQPQYLLQYRGADGDGAGLPQQDQLPPQDPGQGT